MSGLALDAGDVRATHVLDVFVLVDDLLDRERDDLEAHLVQVVRDAVAHAAGDDLRLLDDLLDLEQADDAAQVAFHDQPHQRLALFGRLGQELLGGGADALGVRLDFDLRHGLDRHRHALRGVQLLLGRDVERHQLERQLLKTLEQRPDDAAAAGDDVGAAPAVDDQGAVRADAPEQVADGPHHQNQQRHDRDQHDRLTENTFMSSTPKPPRSGGRRGLLARRDELTPGSAR